MASFSYVGNPDYRGYLAAQAQSDPNSLAATALNLVGNNGGYDPNKLAQYAAGPGGGSDQASIDALKNYISSTYSQYNTLNGGQVLGASTTASSPAAAGPSTAQAQSSLQQAIDRIGTQQAAGNASLDSQSNTALQQLLLGYNQGQSTYNQSKQTNATNYVGAKNTIGSNAGSTLNGLLRLLGSRGAGGSSAYNTAAPDAVARGATLQRADAGTNFAQNQQGLDTGWGNYQTGYNNQVTGVKAQRDQGKTALANTLAGNQASLLQSLAQLQANPGAAQPYLDQANTLLNQTASYQAPQINYQTQAYTPPSLASYNTTPNATPTFNNQGSGDYFSPYLQSLLGKKQPATG